MQSYRLLSTDDSSQLVSQIKIRQEIGFMYMYSSRIVYNFCVCKMIHTLPNLHVLYTLVQLFESVYYYFQAFMLLSPGIKKPVLVSIQCNFDSVSMTASKFYRGRENNFQGQESQEVSFEFLITNYPSIQAYITHILGKRGKKIILHQKVL